MDSSTKSRIAAALIALSVLSAFGMGGAGASAGFNTETTDTPGQSEIVNGTVLSNITGNLSTEHVVSVTSDTNNTKVVLTADGAGYDAAVDTDGEFVENASGTLYRNHTFTNGDLLDVEHTPGENVTMTAIVYNNTSVADGDADSANITFYAEFNNDTATEVVTDGDVDAGDLATITSENFTIAGYELSSTDNSEIEAEDLEVPQETLYIAAANGSVADDVTSVLDDFDTESKASSVLSGWGPNALVRVSDGDTTRYVPVYTGEAPDDAPDTYGVVTNDIGGTSGLELHGLSEHFDAGDEVDVTAAFGTGTSGYLWGYLSQGITSMGMTTVGTSGGAFALLAPVSLRRRDGPAVDADSAADAEA